MSVKDTIAAPRRPHCVDDVDWKFNSQVADNINELAAWHNAYDADSTLSDQGAVDGKRKSVAYIAQTVGTSTYAVIALRHDPRNGATTTYTWDTSLDLTAYPYLYVYIEPGAVLDRTTGDEVLTVYSPENILAAPRQQITAVGMIDFEYGGTVYPEWWGAKADNSTLCHTAFGYANNALPDTNESGVIRFLSGAYKMGATVTINRDGLAIYGDGPGATIITRDADYGDTIEFNQTQNNRLGNIRFWNDYDVTSGAHIFLDRVSGFEMSNVKLQEMYIGVDLASSQNCSFDNLQIVSNYVWSGAKAGSCFFKLRRLAGGNLPSEINVSNFNFRGNTTNTRVQHGVWVSACDGIYFANGHVGLYCYGSSLYAVQDNNDDLLAGINFDNVYLDGADMGIHFANNATATAINGSHKFANCEISQQATSSVKVLAANLFGMSLTGCYIGMSASHAVHLLAGSHYDFTGCQVFNVDDAEVGGIDGYHIEGSANHVNINGGRVRTQSGYAMAYGAQLAGGGSVDYVSINSVDFSGTFSSGAFGDGSGAVNNKISQCLGWKTINRGSASVMSGNTYVDVTHGLAVTPNASDIAVIGAENPTNSVGTIWVDNIGATTFRVNVENDPGASNWDFEWRVDTED